MRTGLDYPEWSGWISTFGHGKDNNPVCRFVPNLERFYDVFQHVEANCSVETCGASGKCPEKTKDAWSPGYMPDGKRAKVNVAGLWVMAFDLDQDVPGYPTLTEERLEAIDAKLEGTERLVQTSHSFPKKLCVRIIFPLARKVSRQEWPALWNAVRAKYDLPADPKPRHEAALFFFASHPKGAPFLDERRAGALLDPDSLILEYQASTKSDRKKKESVVGPEAFVPEPPLESGSLNYTKTKRYLYGYKPRDDIDGEKREMIRRIIAEEPLADSATGTSVVFKGVELRQRSQVVYRAATIVGWLLPLGTHVDLAMEMMRPSLAKIPSYPEDDSEEVLAGWLSIASRYYEKAQESKKVLKKLDDEGRELVHEVVHRDHAAERVHTPENSSANGEAEINDGGSAGDGDGGSGGGNDGDQNDDPVDPEDRTGKWRLRLRGALDDDGVKKTANSSFNVALVLDQHSAWRDKLRFNTVSLEIESANTPLDKDDAEADLTLATEHWLQEHEDIAVKTSVVEAEIFFAAKKRKFDPVKDYLGTPEWDGQGRIDVFLEDYCGAELTDEDGADITSYVRKIGAKWLIGGAARGLNPGCKVDNVLVLEGDQGAGKTSMLEVLGGEFYLRSDSKLTDRDSKMLIAGGWIIELSELSSLRKTETEAQKGFFSSREDSFRLPYGRRMMKFPRHCVFAATTNETHYLQDETGNRRYWPVRCSFFDIKRIKRDRDQIWAEAVHRYRRGETWWFDKEDAAKSEEITDKRLRGVSTKEIVLKWWRSLANRPEYITKSTVASGALHLPNHMVEANQGLIGNVLKSLGFQRVQLRIDGKRQWVYVPNKYLLEISKKDIVKGELEARIASAQIYPIVVGN